MKEKETSKVEVEAEEISNEDDVAIILIKEEATILDHITKEEVEIFSGLLIKEEEEVTIIKKDLIVFIMGSLDTKL